MFYKYSLTHQHLCNIINTEITNFNGQDKVIRILDVGCGNGFLIYFLQKMLPALHQNYIFEIYGFDVGDSQIQTASFFEKTLLFLSKEFPDIIWSERLIKVTSNEVWPYSDQFFDFVISNQVMEHIFDHKFVFSETNRVLANGGIAVHLFPLKYYLWETHLNLPFVHWIYNEAVLYQYIIYCSLLGMGKYKKHLQLGYTSNVYDFARQHADYMIHETNYLSMNELYFLAKQNGLRCSFKYTGEFYFNKLRHLLKRPIKQIYSLNRYPFLERLSFILWVRLASVTVFLEKKNSYQQSYRE